MVTVTITDKNGTVLEKFDVVDTDKNVDSFENPIQAAAVTKDTIEAFLVIRED